MNAPTRTRLLFLAVALTLAAAAGCSSFPTKFGVLHPGHIAREHGKPMEGGYYQDFDPDAAMLKVEPLEDTNQVQTQHVLIATVTDASGKPLDSRRVEWLIQEGSVGSIVEVDESGWYDTRGAKIDNKYAVTHTNRNAHVITRGNDDPKDDIHIEPGQTWCVITSPVEGDTHVVAYAPAIFNWDKHKVFLVKHWQDAAWKWPPDATNAIGTPHELAVKVMKASDGSPLEGMVVHFKVASGPKAVLEPGKKPAIAVKTDAAGIAKATLHQAKPTEGANVIEMEIIRPEDKQCCKPAVKLASGKMTKTWVGPRIGIEKTATPRAGVGDTITYDIVVTNPGKADATNTKVVDVMPDGITYVSSRPEAKVDGQTLTWNLGRLAKGTKRSLTVKAKTTRTGTFWNPVTVTADHGLKDDAKDETVVTAPKLTLEKTGPAEALICEPIPIKVVVRNTGDGPATGVKIMDELPDGLTCDGSRSVSVDVGTLKPGQAKQATYTLRASKRGAYTNTATAKGAGGLKAEASHKITVREPVLVLTKTGPKKRYIGTNIAYDITVANKGNGEARRTVLTDTLPGGVTFVSATGGGKASGGRITWDLGTIPPDGSKKVSVTCKAARAGNIRNVISATAVCSKASAESVTQVAGIPAILLECVDNPDPIEVGTNTTYTITVTNQGSAVGTGIQITCIMPAELDYVSSTGPTKAATDGKAITFAPLAELAPKAKATYRVVVKGTKAGDVRFSVKLKSNQMTSSADETESTHIYE